MYKWGPQERAILDNIGPQDIILITNLINLLFADNDKYML